MAYDSIKTHDGQKYKGMAVGASHNWDYPDGKWKETKIAPDIWRMRFSAIKGRRNAAPVGSGVPEGTQYHWMIAADQTARKIDADHYETMMDGLKFKVGYKKPNWRGFSYTYDDQPSANEQKIKFLRSIIVQLRQEEKLKRAGGLIT